jgi:tetratricopeptide (TPR) repeat protein
MLKARSILVLALLFTLCFSLATHLQPRQSARVEAEGQTGNVLVLLLGDGRKMFANQFFAKADTYFHKGNYPSIFDRDTPPEENHMAGEASHGEHADGDHDTHAAAAPPAQDWIASFGNHFRPVGHEELGGDVQREILPWLRLAVELDPHQIQTYAVTAHFLRDRMGRVDEAKEFLREGLRFNPNQPELLYQLGACLRKQNDLTRANNLWTAALRRWRETEQPKKEPDLMLLRSILDGLTLVAVQEGRISQAIEYLQQLKDVSPLPENVQKRIDELKARLPNAAGQ